MKGFSSFARTVALAAVLSVPVTATAAETIDLNQASAEELVQLDGIGPKSLDDLREQLHVDN